MAGNRIVAKYIPLNERTHIIGYSELMGYLGVNSREKLLRDYVNRGLFPELCEFDKTTKRWKRATVDKWLDDHRRNLELRVGPGRAERKRAAAQ